MENDKRAAGQALPAEYDVLVERLAVRTHKTWMCQRREEGWTLGPERNDARRETPCMVAYGELPESERVFDRRQARACLLLLMELGCDLAPAAAAARDGEG